MQQLNFIEAGKLEWREAPEPRLEADREAIVEPGAVATCDLDTLTVRGAVPLQGPFPLRPRGRGASGGGRDAVKDVVPGDLGQHPLPGLLRLLRAVQAGRSATARRCPAPFDVWPGSAERGFLSDRVRLPFADHMLLALPKGVAPESVASLSDNIVDAWRTVGPELEQEPGAEVLIISAEELNPCTRPILPVRSARGESTSSAADDASMIAERLGANEGDFPERLGPYPITVNASDSLAGLACALRSTGPDGVCTIRHLSLPRRPLLEMYTKGIHFLTGRVHARETMAPALALVEQGSCARRVGVVRWDDAAEALGELNGKTVVRHDVVNPASGREYHDRHPGLRSHPPARKRKHTGGRAPSTLAPVDPAFAIDVVRARRCGSRTTQHRAGMKSALAPYASRSCSKIASRRFSSPYSAATCGAR